VRGGWCAVVGRSDRVVWWATAVADRAGEVVRLGRFALSSSVRTVRARSRRRSVAADVVVVTVLGTGAIVDGRFRDGYFGELPDALAARGERVVVYGQLGDRPQPDVVARLGEVQEPQVITVWQMVTPWASFRAAWRSLRTRVRTDRLTCEPPITEGLVRQALRGDAVMRAEAFLLLAGLEVLLEAAPTCRVIHMYEGNPWERAANLAALGATPPRHAIGYLHAPVLPAHQKYRFDPTEMGLRPLPDRFVCTGPVAAERLRAIGDWEGMEVLPGCALRMPELDVRPPRQRPPREVRRILFVLDALLTSASLLAIADAVAVLLGPDIEVAVRAHPALPASGLASPAGVELDRSAFVLSCDRALADDLDASDVVVYRGSSVALLAVFWGIPVVHIESRDQPTDDPLDGWDDLKGTASTPLEVVAAVRRATTVPVDEHERAVAATRTHIELTLAPADDDGLSAFGRPVGDTTRT
jgi:surface carbohydrate biosynthesis protein (TIGR04326 family)